MCIFFHLHGSKYEMKKVSMCLIDTNKLCIFFHLHGSKYEMKKVSMCLIDTNKLSMCQGVLAMEF